MTAFRASMRTVTRRSPSPAADRGGSAARATGGAVPLLHRVVRPLASWIVSEGIELQSVGIDPVNDARDIPLQLRVDRYERMTKHFERIGPFGIRMMRQTAAIQVSLDRGDRPAERWRLLNDLAPYLIAIFANSPKYLGRDTGHQSFRAHCWRQLDPSRTGVAEPSDDPAAAYARFALGATEIFDDSLEAHLTTRFPEVGPRGHFEVRSCDAVAPEWYAAPVVFLSGIAYDERASREAGLLAAESRALLRTAGELGLKDPSIARTARDLFQLALDGARRLGEDYVGGEMLEAAAAFGRNTRRIIARDRKRYRSRAQSRHFAVLVGDRRPSRTYESHRPPRSSRFCKIFSRKSSGGGRTRQHRVDFLERLRRPLSADEAAEPISQVECDDALDHGRLSSAGAKGGA